MSTFDSLIDELMRDVHRVQPRDVLQYCANWFRSRLEEQRARIRDALAENSYPLINIPTDLYSDIPITNSSVAGRLSRSVSPFAGGTSPHRSPLRDSVAASPFGTLNVPGNALLSTQGRSTPPVFSLGHHPPTAPRSPRSSTSAPSINIPSPNPFGYHTQTTPTASNANPGDFLHPPTSSIFERRTSVSAESIAVDSMPMPPLPVYPKTSSQLQRIKASIKNNFIFRDLDEEQQRGALNAMRELQVKKNEVVIRQGDVGEFFYAVESGILYCYKRPEPLPESWDENTSVGVLDTEEDLSMVDYHQQFGQKVAVCKPGNSFGELALMYGHNRKATVMAIQASTLWSLDRITFRTIILSVAHRRRTMYERFLSTVTLLTPLDAQERSKIADALVSKVYEDGQVVVKQGDVGDTFFFIEEGEATVTKVHEEDGSFREIKVGVLGKGDYFGELSLLRLAPRAATVSAVQRRDRLQPKLKVAALDAHAFTRLLGPLRDIMERRAGTYPS